MKKKVIFVGGTSFSGSTFLHMVLANDPRGFAVGEMQSQFHPVRVQQIKRDCGCGDPACDLWPQVRAAGEEHAYEAIFDRYPDIDFIVDSSKNSFWVQQQHERLQRRGIDTAHIMIWKTPLEFAASSKKRSRLEGWDAQWVNYHRLYFSIIQGWQSLSYRQFTADDTALEPICRFLGIPYFANKKEYWHKTHHSQGGNYTARFHLDNQKQAAEKLSVTFDADRMNLYRRIFYLPVDDPELQQMVEGTIQKNKHFTQIMEILAANSVISLTTEKLMASQLAATQLPAWLVYLRKFKYQVEAQRGRQRSIQFANA